MHHRSLSLPVVVAAALAACSPAPSVETNYLERYTSQLTVDANEVAQTFAAQIAGATTSIDLALSDLDEPQATAALVAAAGRGVRVRVVTDVDQLGSAGMRALDAAGIEIVAGDGPVDWSPSPGLIVIRDGSHSRMTHNFAIFDAQRVLTVSTPPVLASGFSAQVYALFESADVAKDFGDVFDQMFGGVFATTLTAFGDPIPADTNNRTRIPMVDGSVVSLWFGPQEPVIKELIDRVYEARASVFIATQFLANRELVSALRYKAEAGFVVRVVVAEDGAALAGSRFAELEALFAGLDPNATDAAIATAPLFDFNAAVFDSETSPVDGLARDAMLMVTTQPLVETIPFITTDAGAVSRPSDTFFDSHAWAIQEQSSQPNDTTREVAAWIATQAL